MYMFVLLLDLARATLSRMTYKKDSCPVELSGDPSSVCPCMMYILKLIRRIHYLSYGKCIYKLYKCISDVKRGKKWERVFRSWNANNFSHGSSLPSSCLLQPLVCTSAQNAQKSCAFSPNWIFFFCKTEFSLFSDEEFLRCHCWIPPPVKSLRNEKAFRKTAV